jgi:hypothetical protein
VLRVSGLGSGFRDRGSGSKGLVVEVGGLGVRKGGRVPGAQHP